MLKHTVLPSLFLLLLCACSAPVPDEKLKNTYWSLLELNGEDKEVFDRQPDLHLIFHINDASLHGSDGCNQIRATYQQKEDSFRFTNILSTRMSCLQGLEQSRDFMQVLRDTDQLVIDENYLILYQNGFEIARFEAKEDY